MQGGIALDDSFVSVALSTLEARLAAARALPARVNVVIENSAETRDDDESKNPRPFTLTLSATGDEVRELWVAVLCESLRLMPALELFASASARWAPLLRENCVGAEQRLRETELRIHEEFDDGAATWADHASLAHDNWISAFPAAPG